MWRGDFRCEHIGFRLFRLAVPYEFGHGSVSTSTGSPEAVTRPRFPQNVACRFTAPRSSAVASQHRECLQLPMREPQFGSQ